MAAVADCDYRPPPGSGSRSHERFEQTDSLGRPGHPRCLVLVLGCCGEPATGQISHCRDGRHEGRSGGQRRGCALGRTRPPDTDISRALAGDPGGSAVAASGGWTEPAGAVPRTRPPHARPLQFLPMGLPRRSRGGDQVRRLQARRWLTGQLAFPSHRRGTVLSRHRRLGHDLLYLLQHAVRLLSERRHQHRQRTTAKRWTRVRSRRWP